MWIFKSRNRMDDFGAEVMNYGDLSEAFLKVKFYRRVVSVTVYP
ncbi:DUF3289 family protein, partial [Yersinia pestis]